MLKLKVVCEDPPMWHITFEGAKDSLYSGEVYTLQFKFGDEYPFDSPEVMFIGTPP